MREIVPDSHCGKGMLKFVALLDSDVVVEGGFCDDMGEALA